MSNCANDVVIDAMAEAIYLFECDAKGIDPAYNQLDEDTHDYYISLAERCAEAFMTKYGF